ncbi:amino acid ABC transporter permease [Paractinoplanes hotanensis]|uniref:Amino acid ABC transporter permease n=1 Tax=Paractinoplanes hotanensis TaxID=2906497 RepID=A0ABT0Y6V3_9ACTN|nr:amino acid ABC transporter permease [Actinoplanes hotanensis]MCM4081049.1 amino acid ABC transporter permease [Actinoplanes hotanensis]
MTQTTTATRAAPKRDVVPVRHWGRMTGAAVVVLLVLGAAYSFATNPNFEWSVVGQYLFAKTVLKGLLLTLEMTAIGMVIALVLAVVIGVMRMSPSRVIAGVAAAWVFFFRGVPLIVLLIVVGNLGLFFKSFTLGIPFTGVVFWSAPVGQVVTPFVASVIGLSLAGSGYMAEIVRSGLLAVGRGQHETAKALGLNRAQTLRHIVLPQALRVIIPPLGNESIGMLKASAIVSVIAGGDLLTVVEGISGINFRTIEMLIVATIWYLLVISVYSIAQFFLERRAAER